MQFEAGGEMKYYLVCKSFMKEPRHRRERVYFTTSGLTAKIMWMDELGTPIDGVDLAGNPYDDDPEPLGYAESYLNARELTFEQVIQHKRGARNETLHRS